MDLSGHILLALTVSAFGGSFQDGSLQTAPPVATVEQQAQLPDVVVTGGRSVREAIDAFVDEVVAPPADRGPARWDRKVCVGVVNLRQDAAQALIDRISQVALDVELEIGEPGCSPNILIIATDDGPGLATTLVGERPNAFRPPYAGAARSIAQLERFQNTDRPVRWWHVSLPTDVDTGQIAVRLPGQGPPILNVLGGRLRTEIQNDLRRAFIIVDFSRTGSVTFQQLSDYVAMVAFAQIDPDAEVSSFDTVLNVFDNPAAADGMTDWDLSYLRALYSAELNQRSPNHQAGAIGGIMVRDREKTDSPPPAE